MDKNLNYEIAIDIVAEMVTAYMTDQAYKQKKKHAELVTNERSDAA